MTAGGGGGSMSLKDFYRDKVLNGTFDDTCTATVYSDRITLNEGKFGVDTTNHQVYFYYDFTIKATISSSSWGTIMTFPSNFSNYLPRYTTSARTNLIGALTDSSSSAVKNFFHGYASSSNARQFGLGYGQGATVNENYIVYGSWTY